ncbi:MAG: OmpH family outer membrane protein [Elusimicrobiota bacterium]
MLIALSVCVPARAIELALEENRAERGSVGFVDMQRLFKASPDASRAREGLEELVRQAEERVNGKKADILKLRQDLESLGVEREELAKAPPPTPARPPEPAKPIEPAASAASTTPATGVPETSTQPSVINLPGLGDSSMKIDRPGTSPLNPTAQSTPTQPAAAPPAPNKPNSAQRLIEIDGQLAAKRAEIARLQADLDRERQGTEKNLLDAEGRKTDQVLARLYRAISEVAKKEGVSVVVDKAATLYGHPAVDLTDKVLKQLSGSSATPTPQ